MSSGSAKVSETKYYPYGVIQEGGSDKYLYTGKELDKGTGLYYYEARYYNPNVGRFIQPDTIIPSMYNPQALNRYSYVLNNPLRYTDPSGYLPTSQEQIGNIEQLEATLEWRVNEIKTNNPEATNTQILSEIAEWYRTYPDNNPPKTPEGVTVPRYIYTEKGLIDLKHYFYSAKTTIDYGGASTFLIGYGLEVYQYIYEPESGFSPEDLISNRYGRGLIGIAGRIPGLSSLLFNSRGEFTDEVISHLNALGPLDRTEYPSFDYLPQYWGGSSDKKYTSLNSRSKSVCCGSFLDYYVLTSTESNNEPDPPSDWDLYGSWD